jgi:hypothetical protein
LKSEYHLIYRLHIPNFANPERHLKYHPQCAHRHLPDPALIGVFILGRGANELKNSPHAKRANEISSNILVHGHHLFQTSRCSEDAQELRQFEQVRSPNTLITRVQTDQRIILMPRGPGYADKYLRLYGLAQKFPSSSWDPNIESHSGIVFLLRFIFFTPPPLALKASQSSNTFLLEVDIMIPHVTTSALASATKTQIPSHTALGSATLISFQTWCVSNFHPVVVPFHG